MSSIILLLIGLAVGGFGTMIGAGGGFILVPILLLMYPDKNPEVITGISLAVVFFNASSGSLAYGLKRRIDYRSAWIFCITTLPGSVLGALTSSYISRDTFNLIFSIVLLILATILLVKPIKKQEANNRLKNRTFWDIARYVIDIEGVRYIFRYNVVLGSFISFFVGFASSLLGIGGGIIHVPVMVNLLNFPIHIATATSHFVLALMAFTGSTVHYFQGVLSQGINEIVWLGLGVIIGAQVGARYSTKVKGSVIIRSLAFALILVGLRILWLGLS